MARFLKLTDYDDQIREEIRDLLDNTPDSRILIQAEDKAVAQMRGWLSSRYDCNSIFSPESESGGRNEFIVMIAIDITLYHLWSKERGKIPQIRNDRYQDALDWLKKAGAGELVSDLPTKPQNEVTGGIQIYSIHNANNHKY